MINSYGTVIKQKGKYSFSSEFLFCRRSHTTCFGEKTSSSSGVHKFPNVMSKHLLNFRIVGQSKHLISLDNSYLFIYYLCTTKVTNKQLISVMCQVVHIKYTQFSFKECRTYI